MQSSILEPHELAILEAGRQALQARADARARRGSEIEEYRRQAKEDNERRWQQERDAAERAELKALGRWGPCLPPYKRRAPRLYVQEEDLEDLIPDGWGDNDEFRQDAKRLGQRLGFRWSVVMVLIFVEWFHGLRPSTRRTVSGTGGGLQASPAWLGRKLGLAERTIQRAQAFLDPLAAWRRERARVKLENGQRRKVGKAEKELPPKPTGTVYAGRFPQLKRYSLLTADLPPHERRARWMDRQENLHEWVDLTGVWLPTHMGVRVLRRRHSREDLQPRVLGESRRGKPFRSARTERGCCAVEGCTRELYRKTRLCRVHFKQRQRRGRPVKLRRSPMAVDLYRRLRPAYRRLRARLAPAPIRTITPNNDPRVDPTVYSRGVPLTWRAVDNFNPPDSTGPPSEGRSARSPTAAGAAMETPAPRAAPVQASSPALPDRLSGLGMRPTAEPRPEPLARPPRTLREAEEAWGARLAELRGKKAW